MKKKSQVTLLILVGIIILILFGFLFYSGKLISESRGELIDFNRDSVDTFVTSCIRLIGTSALNILGKQGGHLYPADYIITPVYNISYLAIENTNKVPTIEQMEDELSRYMDRNS